MSFLKALIYFAFHPGDTLHLTVVRRYADAQKHFIGELYVGEGREARMIGWSCDNLPLVVQPKTAGKVRWGRSFLDPMDANTILVGGQSPADNQYVYDFVSLRRFCEHKVLILNRFIEHAMEQDNVR